MKFFIVISECYTVFLFFLVVISCVRNDVLKFECDNMSITQGTVAGSTKWNFPPRKMTEYGVGSSDGKSCEMDKAKECEWSAQTFLTKVFGYGK